jgi:hypothetical protein
MLIASSGRVTSYPGQALGAVWVYNFGFITVFLFNLVFHLRKVPDSPGVIEWTRGNLVWNMVLVSAWGNSIVAI